jgi:DNA-binding transcriptional regulator YiaG
MFYCLALNSIENQWDLCRMSEMQTSGSRVKLARSMLGLTRKQFEANSNISVNTLQAWESEKNMLTDKGAKKLIEAFIKLGLMCSEDWLLTGNGQAPILLQGMSELPNEMSEDLCILREIETFKALNPDPVVVIVQDNGMEPMYAIGDFVGGNRKKSDQIDRLIGKNCIIETLQGDTFVRKILKGSKPQLFNLACINIGTDQQPIIPDMRIKCAAKIVLVRKKEDFE